VRLYAASYRLSRENLRWADIYISHAECFSRSWTSASWGDPSNAWKTDHFMDIILTTGELKKKYRGPSCCWSHLHACYGHTASTHTRAIKQHLAERAAQSSQTLSRKLSRQARSLLPAQQFALFEKGNHLL
jgi:hypothetical protein